MNAFVKVSENNGNYFTTVFTNTVLICDIFLIFPSGVYKMIIQ